MTMRLMGTQMGHAWPWTPGYFLEPGRALVEAVDVPVVALGGLNSAATMRLALDRGCPHGERSLRCVM